MQDHKTIWVLLRSHVVGLPPIMTVLQCLLETKKYQVNFISTQSSGVQHKLFNEFIIPQNHNVNKVKKIKNYLDYRLFVNKIISGQVKKEDVIWVGSLDTALACKGLKFLSSNQYILHLHELYDAFPKKLESIKVIAQNAKHVVVPEINRAGILQVWLSLKERPVVIPNKPFFHPRKKRLSPTHEQTKNILDKFKTNKPIILYQGHISSDRNLMPIALAMKSLPQYEFWLLGFDHGYVDSLLKVSNNIKYLGCVLAPYHLEITSYADIGIMSYDLISLNNLYCAPNKIWEYAGFGIPFFANECLSLQELFLNQIGVPVSWNEESIKNAINIIQDNVVYRKNAIVFFDSVDLVGVIVSVVK